MNLKHVFAPYFVVLTVFLGRVHFCVHYCQHIYSACFDSLNQIDALNYRVKRLFSVVKRNTDVRSQ